MRVAVMGAGGLGGYYGGALARAGQDVTFVARGAQLAALRAGGLTVRSEQAGDFHVEAPATDDPSRVGPVDLVLFCVKNYDVDAAAEGSRPLVGPDTAVLPVQNGVEATERIGRAVGAAHVLGGVCYLAARVDAPGTVVQGGVSGKLLFGEPAGGVSDRCARLADAFERVHRSLGPGSGEPPPLPTSDRCRARRPDLHGRRCTDLPPGRAYQFKLILDAAGLPRSWRPHDLKHAHLMTLLRAKVDLVTVGKRAGHARLQTTQRYLDHLAPDVEVAAAAAWGEAIRRPTELASARRPAPSPTAGAAS
jgi:hypothetical protein